VAEQRYQAVLAVISDGLTISQVAQKVGVSRQTLHSWLARYEAEGLEGLVDRSQKHRRGTKQTGTSHQRTALNHNPECQGSTETQTSSINRL
jgi:transposase